MGVSASLSMAATVTQTKALDLTTTSDPLIFRRAVSLLNGTTAGKADRVFHDRRTLAASATEDLDLAGALTDAFGASLTFVRIKGLFISAAVPNTNNVVIGAAGANPWATLLNTTGTVALRPGASLGVMAGDQDPTAYTVTAGTGDQLKVTNSGAGTPVTYDVIVIGASA
ncbi:hypothetical protein AB0I94_02395 [Streptomyces sp. NPDC050147]|uniref:hypothetical protein n=1 Tax=Streptomyces sp. NPDC050147 TaxID=3155513 RepID=UPI00343E8855